MTSIHLPQLYCPFPSEVNTYAKLAQTHTTNWVHTFQLIQSDAANQKFQASKFPLLSARAFPHADLEELLLVSDWNTWLFMLDDVCDEAGIGKNPERLQQTFDDLLDVLWNDKRVNLQTGNPLAASLSDLWVRLQSKAPPGWTERFAQTVKRYFEGCYWEAQNREKNRKPGVTEYMKMRPYAGAVYTDIDLIEITEKLILPEHVLNHPTVKELAYLANATICWSNDLFSYEKEKELGDVHNLVLAIYYEQKVSMEEAVQEAVQIHDRDVYKYIQLEKQLPSFGENIDQQLKLYLRALRSWMRGHIDWCCLDTGRYEEDLYKLGSH